MTPLERAHIHIYIPLLLLLKNNCLSYFTLVNTKKQKKQEKQNTVFLARLTLSPSHLTYEDNF